MKYSRSTKFAGLAVANAHVLARFDDCLTRTQYSDLSLRAYTSRPNHPRGNNSLKALQTRVLRKGCVASLMLGNGNLTPRTAMQTRQIPIKFEMSVAPHGVEVLIRVRGDHGLIQP